MQGPPKVYGALREDILEFIKQAQERVLSHQEEQALLKAYIAEWRKFFTQCSYLPMPFGQLETALQVRSLQCNVICKHFLFAILHVVVDRAKQRPMYLRKPRQTSLWCGS